MRINFMSKIKAALIRLRPSRKAIVGAVLAGAAVVAAVPASDRIDWQTVAKAALAVVLTGGGVYQTTNTPPTT